MEGTMQNRREHTGGLFAVSLILLASGLGAIDIRTVGATPGEDRFPSAVRTTGNPEETRIIVAFEYELSETDHDIYLAWSANDGRDWNIRQGATAKDDERYPRLAMGVGDTVHLVYQATDTLGWIYASAYNFSWVKTSWASTWSKGCQHPDVACDPVTNTIWFVMEKGSGQNHNITACHMDGVARTYDTVKVANDAKDELYPVVACDMNNVLVLYEYHDGTDVDVRGATSKTTTAGFTAVEISQTLEDEFHPEVVSTNKGFEYVFQTGDSLYYGYSASGTSHEIHPVAAVSGDVAPSIDADGLSADIVIRKDSITLSHFRVEGQDPLTVKQASAKVPGISSGARQVQVVTKGDSAFCIWSGSPGIGSSNIYGTWWSKENPFAVAERFNPDYDPELVVTPIFSGAECVISFIPATEGHADLGIFDASGARVRTLLSKRVLPAYFTLTWDGRDEKGISLSEGVYFARLADARGVRTAKIVLVR